MAQGLWSVKGVDSEHFVVTTYTMCGAHGLNNYYKFYYGTMAVHFLQSVSKFELCWHTEINNVELSKVFEN